jgi:hypothetical protein
MENAARKTRDGIADALEELADEEIDQAQQKGRTIHGRQKSPKKFKVVRREK